MPAPQDVTVSIFGRSYTLRSEADPHAVQALAAEVDARMREAAEGAGPVGLDRLAVLVALNLADELSREQLAGKGHRRAQGARLERLVALLANEVGNEGSSEVS